MRYSNTKILLLLMGLFFYMNAETQEITLMPFAENLNQPVAIKHAGDERLFVVEKNGFIQIINADGSKNEAPFLDIDQRVSSGGGEKGLLGLAFHPDFTNNGFFFVNYTTTSSTVIARYAVSDTNANVANRDSELVLMTIAQPYSNHNGGDIHFGPDGYLYIGMGDGGSGGDPENRAQNLASLLGKMLRLDVDNGNPYGIPSDNPFVGDTSIPDEIWAYGLRNPWRFSFDALTGDLYIGDVGQNAIEEIDFLAANTPGGQNYGWRCYEGDGDFIPGECPNPNDLTFPIQDYNQSSANGCSVTGGVVYRGPNVGSQGKYIYGDFCSGRFWTLERNTEGEWENEIVGDMSGGELAAFGEDINGEVYVAAISSGRILKVQFPIVNGIGDEVESTLEFWPNPTSGKINISGEITDNLNIQILSAEGKGVLSKVLTNQTNKFIDISSLPIGNYYLTYQLDGQKFVEKIVRL